MIPYKTETDPGFSFCKMYAEYGLVQPNTGIYWAAPSTPMLALFYPYCSNLSIVLTVYVQQYHHQYSLSRG